MRITILLFSLLFLIAGCSNKNPHYDPSKSHHREDGFANRYSGRAKKEGFWKWQWERRVADLPKPPTSPIQPVEPDLSFIQNNRTQTAATWVGPCNGAFTDCRIQYSDRSAMERSSISCQFCRSHTSSEARCAI